MASLGGQVRSMSLKSLIIINDIFAGCFSHITLEDLQLKNLYNPKLVTEIEKTAKHRRLDSELVTPLNLNLNLCV